MDRLKWLSLVVVGAYVIWLFVLGGAGSDLSGRRAVVGAIGMVFWLGLSLGLIWYGDEIGEGLTGACYGLVSSPSPGWAVQLVGWMFLLMPAAIVIFYSRG